MDSTETSYDIVQYPSALYRTTHPEHLAAIARLHGLDAADPRRARVLEIAGGDGFNVLAMAAAFPDASFVSIDLAASAVARGRTLAEAAGLSNVRVEVADVLAAASTLPGQFDYVIAHGLYAWVPPAVQDATLQLIDRVLAPDGIAYISYNALPGCHLRKAVRDMLLFELAGIDDRDEKLRQAAIILTNLGTDQPDDSISEAALRKAARHMRDKDPQVLFHDELGPVYDPKLLYEMVSEAARHRLSYLGEAQPGGLFHGLPGRQVDDATLIREAQLADFRNLCFFHQSLFIRPDRHPLRVAEPERLCALLAGVPNGLRRTGQTTFAIADGSFEIDDAPLADFLERLALHAPARFPLAPFASSPAHCEALLQLVNRGIIELHSLPYPGVIEPGEHPRANDLLRSMIGQGASRVWTLDHRAIDIRENGARQFLSLLDGSRDRDALAREWAALGASDTVDVNSALSQLAKAGLLSA